MYPTLKHLQPIKIDRYYYDSDLVKNGDIVVAKISEKQRVVKRVVATEGDRFKLLKKNSGCHLKINELTVKNTHRENHLFPKSSCKMFSLYIFDYKGLVPENAALILGDNLEESKDASSFGLISLKQIKGKVIF